jgi:uncharacterized protein YaaR (DUF327 family)
MSLKHKQLQDSIVGRSYLQVAQSKGWISKETLKKEASAPDVQPTTNLTENILKLCHGLRQSGFDKYAKELETKFVQFKQAQTLYNTGKGEGKDLIEAAHPQGSHKLEGLEGEYAIIETILDQHTKIMEKIEKVPHGKLSNAEEIISAVKTVLGQDADPKSLLQSASASVQQALSIAEKVGGLTDIVINWAKGRASLVQAISDKKREDITREDAVEAENAVNALSRNFQPDILHEYLPEFLTKGISDEQTWNQVKVLFDAALKNIREARAAIISQAITQTTKPTYKPGTTEDVEHVKQLIREYLNTLTSWVGKINADASLDVRSKEAGVNWVQRKWDVINDLREKFEKLPADKQLNAAPQILNSWKQVAQEATNFRKVWIDA